MGLWASFRELMNYHPWMKWPVSLAIFWPTVLFARLWAALWPGSRRLWDRMTNVPVLVGAVPIFTDDLLHLATHEHVVGVVNLCREWPHDEHVLSRLGVQQLYLPTVDFTQPTVADCWTAVNWMLRELTEHPEGSIYVHCKAGRGRSVIVVMCFLIAAHGLAPEAAMAEVLAVRPHANKKAHTQVVQLFYALAQEWLRTPAGAGAVDRYKAANAARLPGL